LFVSKGFCRQLQQFPEFATKKIMVLSGLLSAQVHAAGGRGKAGGVKPVKSKEDAKAFAANWLGKRLLPN
jgi:succinyl-CoA synthetase beta subunit